MRPSAVFPSGACVSEISSLKLLALFQKSLSLSSEQMAKWVERAAVSQPSLAFLTRRP